MSAAVTPFRISDDQAVVDLIPRWQPRPGWHEHAACRGMDWFAMWPSHALAVCRACPVRLDCATDAVRYETAEELPPVGIYGIAAATRRNMNKGINNKQGAAA